MSPRRALGFHSEHRIGCTLCPDNGSKLLTTIAFHAHLFLNFFARAFRRTVFSEFDSSCCPNSFFFRLGLSGNMRETGCSEEMGRLV